MPNITAKMKAIQANCPDGYTVAVAGQTIDMLGIKELWIIYSNHPEPELTRIPQDLVDYPYGRSAKRAPKEWGHPIYYRTA